MDDFEPSTGILLILQANTLGGNTLVAEWNASYPPPFSHVMVEVPEEFDYADPKRTSYPGLLIRVPQSLDAHLYIYSLNDDHKRWLEACVDETGCHTSEMWQREGAPYLNLSLFKNEADRDAAAQKYAQLAFLQDFPDCIWAAVEVELVESNAPLGPIMV